MRNFTIFLLLVVTVLFGCSRRVEPGFRSGQGDAGQFILQQALSRGGHPTVTNGLPAVGANWRYSVDKNGMVMRLPREQFRAVESFLQQAFGTPDQTPIETSDGGKLGWYAAKTVGVGIQFGYDDDATQVIVLHPLYRRQTGSRSERFR